MAQPIKDKDGKVLGQFLTQDEYLDLVTSHGDSAFSEEEHEKALKLIESGEAMRVGKSTAEVLAMLQELDRILPEIRS